MASYEFWQDKGDGTTEYLGSVEGLDVERTRDDAIRAFEGLGLLSETSDLSDGDKVFVIEFPGDENKGVTSDTFVLTVVAPSGVTVR